MVYTVVIMRHGESVWNVLNRFTGWIDVELSEKGITEAVEAGKLIEKHQLQFDICYTSLLQRAIKTANIVMEKSNQLWIPQIKSWQLNERMYGALEGLNKTECVEKHGVEQVLKWRRSFDIPPPEIPENFEDNHCTERKYLDIISIIPKTECLKDCVDRVVPFWEKEIIPKLKNGKKVFIAAHGNSIRALVKHLDNISNEDIVELNIPTGIPLVYTLDETFKPVQTKEKIFKPLSGIYLGNVNEVKEKIEGVANQLTKK